MFMCACFRGQSIHIIDWQGSVGYIAFCGESFSKQTPGLNIFGVDIPPATACSKCLYHIGDVLSWNVLTASKAQQNKLCYPAQLPHRDHRGSRNRYFRVFARNKNIGIGYLTKFRKS